MHNVLAQIHNLAAQAKALYNDEVEDFNTLLAEKERLELSHLSLKDQMAVQVLEHTQALAELKAQLEAVQQQRNSTAELLVERTRQGKELERQLKDFRSLDPARVIKHNKTLKERNAELLKANETLKTRNADLQKRIQQAAKDGVEKGVYPVYKDPVDGHLVKLISYIRPREDNEHELVPHVPVVEFYHKTAGVMRQGSLNLEGGISWSSTKNTVPPTRVSRQVASLLVDYCERNKIKIPPHVKLAVREHSLKAAS